MTEGLGEFSNLCRITRKIDCAYVLQMNSKKQIGRRSLVENPSIILRLDGLQNWHGISADELVQKSSIYLFIMTNHD